MRIVDFCDEDHLKEYCRREDEWRGDQGDIDKKNNDSGRDDLRLRLKQMLCLMDTSASS